MSDEKQNKSCDCNLCVGRGCRFCNCEGEAQALPCESCYKLHATNWLEEYPDNQPDDIFEVRFKNTHRSYYRNVNNLPLQRGDIVAVEASPGHDIGIVSLTGDMVARQMRRVGFNPLNGEFKKIYRKAKPYDIEKWQEAIALEHETMIRSRQIAAEMNLNMKIGDVEYQGDKIKAIFYYIADERVDFRELIKVFAEQFHIRIEMKQIGARQEAGRIGGLGSCGRELCCSAWISSFASVTTNAARTQDLSLNPQKLAGQCSKLKCCLVYELDNYLDARTEFPRINEPLQTLDGDYYFIKNDILARMMSFATTPGSFVGMVTLPISRVREIMRLNKEGKKPEKINSEVVVNTASEEPSFVNAIGEESITRFDKAKRKKKRGRNSNDRPKDAAAQSTGGNQSDDNRRSQRRGGNGASRSADNAARVQGQQGGEGKRAQSQTSDTAAQRQSNSPKGRPNGDKPRQDRPQPDGGQQNRTDSQQRNNNNRRRNDRRGKPFKGGNQSAEKPEAGPRPNGDRSADKPNSQPETENRNANRPEPIQKSESKGGEQ